jgi:hypothetical protein
MMAIVERTGLSSIGAFWFSFVLLSMLTMLTPLDGNAAEAVETVNIAVDCVSAGQLCDPPFSLDIETGSLLQMKYSVRADHCSSVKIHIFVDGTLQMTTGFLGWLGAPPPFDALPLDTGVLDLGPVSSGPHLLVLQAEGQVGGCNLGDLENWGGTLQVLTTPPPVCDIQMSQTSYVTGDTVTAQIVQLTNPETVPLSVELGLWFDVPGNPPISFLNIGADGSVQLPAGFDQNFGPMPLATVTPALPRGTYGFNCRIVNPVTKRLIAEDINPFTIQ